MHSVAPSAAPSLDRKTHGDPHESAPTMTHPLGHMWGTGTDGDLPRVTPSGWRYHTPQHFVLCHGRRYARRRLTVEERGYVQAAVQRAGIRPTMGQCYRNCRRTLVLGDVDRRLEYVEGYVRGRWVITHHAWLAIGGKVADVTLDWRALGLDLRVPPALQHLGPPEAPEGDIYFGVRMPLGFILSSPWRSRYGLIEFAPRYRPPTLREPW